MHSPDTLTIREAGPEIAPLFGHIIREAFRGQAELQGFTQEEYPRFVEFTSDEKVRADLKNGNRALILYDGEEAVGGVWYRLAPEEPEVGYVRKLAVLPAHRGQGHGERLFACAEARLKALGANRALLACNGRFTRLHAYYERLGYHPVKREMWPTLPFEVLTMEKELK